MTQEKTSTGYPSIDKPWLKYYSEEAVKRQMEPNTIYGHLYENNKENLEDIALIYFERKVTYRALFDKIEQCKRGLMALGVKKGDIVTIQTLAIPQTVVLFYALSRIGAIANLVYVSNDEDEVKEILKKTKSCAYFVIDSIYAKFHDVLSGTSVKNVILLSIATEMDKVTKIVYRISRKKGKIKYSSNVCSWNAFIGQQNDRVMADEKDDNLPVAMVYTGGTTGKSKAVVLTNRSINELVFQYEKADMGLVRQHVFMNSLPPFIAFGLSFSLHLPLCMGIKTVLIPDPLPQNQGKVFFKYKPNYYVAGPVQIEAILNYPKINKKDLSFVEILATGGDALPASAEKRINDFLKQHNSDIRVFQGYGMSELAATVCTGSPSALRFGTVGIPLPNTNVKIINTDTGEELAYEQQGEVCVCAPSVMKEYFKDADETRKIMKMHEDGKLWIHTGDIGTIDKDGFLTIVGRIKRMILVKEDTKETAVYQKIFPQILEQRIESLEGVNAAVIVSNGGTADEQRLIAFIVPVTENRNLENEIRQYVKGNFKGYEQPVEYRFVSELPRTKIGKVDYRKLECMARKE